MIRRFSPRRPGKVTAAALLASLVAVVGFPAVASAATIFGVTVPPDTLTPVVTGVGLPTSLAFDSSGDLFSGGLFGGISALPTATGSLFGVPVTANTPASVTNAAASGVFGLSADALAFDSAGDLYIADAGTGTISVLPKTTTTLFGVSVTANTLATLVSSGLDEPSALAFDSSGNLYIANQSPSKLSVLPKTTTTLFGVSVTANTLATLVSSGLTIPIGMAFDSSGNLYISNEGSDTVSVLPTTASTLFGVSVTGNTLATLVSSGINTPSGLAFDSAGDLYIAEAAAGAVAVLPKTSSTLFGVSVTANTLAALVSSGLGEPLGLALDSAGDLYIGNPLGAAIFVLPKTTTTLFGVSVTADTLATVASSPADAPAAVAFDPSGDLFIVGTFGFGGSSIFTSGSISVLPLHSGTIFGVPVTANQLTTIVPGSALSEPVGLAFDSSGNLYIANELSATISVLPATTTTLFGVAVTADTLATLASGLPDPIGLAFDSAGDLYVANQFLGAISVLPKSTTTLFGVSVTANSPATVASGIPAPLGLAFDSSGDLYVASATGTVSVLPATTTTLFGVSVTADTVATLASTKSELIGLAFDSAGNLYISSASGGGALGVAGALSVLPKASGSLFGTSVTANMLTTLIGSALDFPAFIAFDSSGDLFIPDLVSSDVYVLAPPSTPSLTPSHTSLTAASATGSTDVVVTAKVTGTGGPPTGMVTFTLPAGYSCAGGDTVTLSVGVATCDIGAISGSVTVKANYLGDPSFAPSSASLKLSIGSASLSAPVSIWVGSQAEWTLTSQASSGAFGVAGITVAFKAGSATLCSAVTNASGQAICQVPESPSAQPGISFKATFAGSGLYTAATSGAGTLVNP